MSLHILKSDRGKEEKRVAQYMQEIREIAQAGLTRRELLKMGLVMGGAGLAAMHGIRHFKPYWGHEALAAGRLAITSPPTQAFVEPLYIPPALTPVRLNPRPSRGPNPTLSAVTGFREANRNPHQRWTEFGGLSDTAPGFTGKMYESKCMELDYSFGIRTDGTPLQSHIWTFVEAATGKIAPFRINAHYGEPVIHRIHNDTAHVGPYAGGFGINQITTHLHNGHTASESDGGPIDFFGPCRFKDYHYANVRAGFASNFPSTISPFNGAEVPGDVLETMGFLWFHDHRFDFTAQNVYKGMASFYTLFSEDAGIDTNDETTGLRLPSGEYDIPLIFTDPAFSEDGELFFDLFNLDGMLGDKEAVNLKIQPFLEVKRRRYRFRMLGGGPSRFRELFLSNGQNFIQISNDGNLLPRALAKKSVRISVAERFDVIVDFSKAGIGEKIRLVNRLEQVNGRGPTGRIIGGTPVLEFRVVGDAPDGSFPYQGGEPLLALPARLPIQRVRNFHFERSGGGWMINGEFFQPDVIREFLPQDAIENWVLTTGKGWSHPIHMHQEEFQILSRNDKAPPDYEIARKDVIDMGQNVVGRQGTGKAVFYTQHRDFDGHYPFHCHNTVHEDHAMMLLFNVGKELPRIDPDIDPIC